MKNKKKIFSCIAGIIILFFACFWGNYEPEETEKESAFKGIISLYDTATPTVLGNDFSVISTICEEFSSRLEGSFVRLSRISYVTEEESYLYASENADIIRYDESLAKEKIITDTEFTAGLKRDHYDIPAPYDNGKVIVPLWYDIYVIIVNRQMVDRELIDSYISPEEFSALPDQGISIGYSDEKMLDLFAESRYPLYNPAVTGKLIFCEEGIRDFYNEKVAVYAGSLKDAAYLVRQEKRNKEVFEYEIFLMPSSEEVIFVSEIGSYAALCTEDELKRDVIMEFMDYLQSDDAVRYTENLGLLPWVGSENITYEKYPYLKEFALSDYRRILVE